MLQTVGICRVLIGEHMHTFGGAVPQNPVGLRQGFVAQGLQMLELQAHRQGIVLPAGIEQRLNIGKGAQQRQCAPHADAWPGCQPNPMCQHVHPACLIDFRQPVCSSCICHITMVAAVAALRDSHRGFIGMISSSWQCSRNSRFTPCPSLPMTTAHLLNFA